MKVSVLVHRPLGRLPARDSRVVYPGAAGPLSGLCFEAHRIDLEDAELLEAVGG